MSVQSELVLLTFADKFLRPLFICTKSFDNKVLKLSKKIYLLELNIMKGQYKFYALNFQRTAAFIC